ncbi:MAG: universal stress protein [Spirulina sp. DLM2.Bin59]|nr:MAG: universal stress protein [Spirulina sp. DLM2.Bin59]
MKTLLLCTDGSLFATPLYQYGAWLAAQMAARINILSVTDIRSQKVASTGNLSGSIGLGASEELLNELVNLEHERAKLNNQRAKLILKNAAQAMEMAGVTDFDLTHRTGFLVDCLEEFEAKADVILLGKRGEAADFASKHLGANVDRIVRSSRKPCFVTPRTFRPIERLLIAYDGSNTGRKMLQFLVETPSLHGLEIHVLTVGKQPEDQGAIARIGEAQQWLQNGGMNPHCQMVVGEPEKAIAQYITDANIDLLLMGAYGHSRIRQLVIGSTTLQLLRSCTIPIFLCR